MADRSVTWFSLHDSPSGSPSRDKTHVRKGKKNKPPNLKLDEQISVLSNKDCTIHSPHKPHRSPPFSPKSPLTSDYMYQFSPNGTASPVSPYKEITFCHSPDGPISPRSLTTGWQQQPKKRSLTPIPEMKLNDKMINLNIEQDHKGKPDFVREISVPDFSSDEIKVIVGRNRIRIVGEHYRISEACMKGSNEPQVKETHKVVNIPSHIDPQSIKVMKQGSHIVIHGYQQPHPVRFSTVCENGFLTTQDNGSVRITVNVPKSHDPNQIRVQTFTKHYLVVTVPHLQSSVAIGHRRSNDAASHVDMTSSPNYNNDHNEDVSDFVETFELPELTNSGTVTSKVVGKHTVVVEVPLGFRERKNTM